MNSKIYYTKPSIGEAEVAYATDAARNGWGENCYDYIYRFEDLFRAHVGAKYAIATSSCTGALHMGLAALGIGRGDEVILSDLNWIATAAPITYLGAKPILVDVLRDTWCIDPEKVELAITPQAQAIIVTHLYGNVCDMDSLLKIGQRRNIPIIEDAAEAIGSSWQGNHAGAMGAFGTYSFHGTKTVTTGEGGMLVTNDPQLYELVKTLNNHGRSRAQNKMFWPDMIGFKYKMSNIEAAIGCAQMERINELISRKREIFKIYERLLDNLPLVMNPERPGEVNGYWMPTIVLNAEENIGSDEIIFALRSDGIDAREFFYPLSSLGLIQRSYNTPISDHLHRHAVNLPSYHDITEQQQIKVANLIARTLHHKGVG